MRIAFVDSKLNLLNGGGSNHSLHILASRLVAMGDEVKVITLDPSLNRYPDNLPYAVVEEGALANRVDRRYRLALLRALRKWEAWADVYHLWEPWLIAPAGVYRFMGGKTPVVAHLNGYAFCTNHGLMEGDCYLNCGLLRRTVHRVSPLPKKILFFPFRALERSLELTMPAHLDAFTAIGPAIAEAYCRQHIPRSKIVVIPPALDYHHLCKLGLEHLRSSNLNGHFNVLYVGRLRPEKGVDTLISSLSLLPFRCTLHIAGDGPAKSALEKRVRELNLSEQVVFHGWVPYAEVVRLYLESHVVVHPARWPEPFGRAIADALALGLPVIASGSSGSSWVIKDSGLTFRPCDSKDLADKIALLHEEPLLAGELARKARERAKDFDFHRIVPRYVEVYRSVVQKARVMGETETRSKSREVHTG